MEFLHKLSVHASSQFFLGWQIFKKIHEKKKNRRQGKVKLQKNYVWRKKGHKINEYAVGVQRQIDHFWYISSIASVSMNISLNFPFHSLVLQPFFLNHSFSMHKCYILFSFYCFLFFFLISIRYIYNFFVLITNCCYCWLVVPRKICLFFPALLFFFILLPFSQL